MCIYWRALRRCCGQGAGHYCVSATIMIYNLADDGSNLYNSHTTECVHTCAGDLSPRLPVTARGSTELQLLYIHVGLGKDTACVLVIFHSMVGPQVTQSHLTL